MKTAFKQQFINKNFMLFLVSNTFAAAMNFGSRILFGIFMPYAWSIVAAYIVGIITAYLLCRQFVFESKKNKTHHEVFYFVLVNVFAIGVTLAVSLALFNYGLAFIVDRFLREEVAHFIGICAPVFFSYLGHKYITFR
ncbi:MAG: GtrA family protein [Coxiellaceae bacterium]|nr:GtrA family protein [Coxiellaceae bacterium]